MSTNWTWIRDLIFAENILENFVNWKNKELSVESWELCEGFENLFLTVNWLEFEFEVKQ